MSVNVRHNFAKAFWGIVVAAAMLLVSVLVIGAVYTVLQSPKPEPASTHESTYLSRASALVSIDLVSSQPSLTPEYAIVYGEAAEDGFDGWWDYAGFDKDIGILYPADTPEYDIVAYSAQSGHSDRKLARIWIFPGEYYSHLMHYASEGDLVKAYGNDTFTIAGHDAYEHGQVPLADENDTINNYVVSVDDGSACAFVAVVDSHEESVLSSLQLSAEKRTQ